MSLTVQVVQCLDALRNYKNQAHQQRHKILHNWYIQEFYLTSQFSLTTSLASQWFFFSRRRKSNARAKSWIFSLNGKRPSIWAQSISCLPSIHYNAQSVKNIKYLANLSYKQIERTARTKTWQKTGVCCVGDTYYNSIALKDVWWRTLTHTAVIVAVY